MRKLMLLLLCGFFAVGCVKFNRDARLVIAKVTARHLGYYIAKKAPDIAERAKPFIKGVLEEEDAVTVRSLLLFSINYISKELNDPVLEADINDLLQVIDVNGELNISEAKLILESILEGLEAYNGKESD